MKRIMVLAAMAALLSLYGCGQDSLTNPSSIELSDEIEETKKGKDVGGGADDYDGGTLEGETIRNGRGRDKVGQADEMGEIKENKKGPDRTPAPEVEEVEDRGGRARDKVGQADEMGEIRENKKERKNDEVPPCDCEPGEVDRAGRARERVQDGN